MTFVDTISNIEICSDAALVINLFINEEIVESSQLYNKYLKVEGCFCHGSLNLNVLPLLPTALILEIIIKLLFSGFALRNKYTKNTVLE